MIKKEMNLYRVVCKDDDGEITLHTKAQDQYEAFERIIMFLREKQFDYRIVLVEFCRSTLPCAPTRRASALRRAEAVCLSNQCGA